jgi:hypothetical protein
MRSRSSQQPSSDRLLRHSSYAVLFAAFIAAHRFFVAILIALLPAALILRFFGFFVAASVGSEPWRNLLYRARCAAAIFRRVAALNFFRGLPVSDGVAAGLMRIPPGNMFFNSVI